MFNSMQSTGPSFSSNNVDVNTPSTSTVASQSNEKQLPGKLNESLVDSSSTLRRSASRYADDFDSIIASKSFAPIIKATSKELIREKEIYFDHENYQDENSNDQGGNVAWDDRIEFPPSTTTTITLNLPETTSQPLRESKSSNDQVSTVDHSVNGNENGGTSSTWFTSSSSTPSRSDKQQRKSKSNLVKKSGRRLEKQVSATASIISTTVAPSTGQFVDSLDLKAAYEKEISEIQSGAISGEKYEDLSDSFKIPPRQVVRSSSPSQLQSKEKQFTKKSSPLVELITTLSPSTVSRSSKVKSSQLLDGVKGGKLIRSEKQKQVTDTLLNNGQVTSYFNWGKSDSPVTTSGQVVTTPITLLEDDVVSRVDNSQLTNKKNKFERQTIVNRKGQVKVSKSQPIQGIKSTKLTLSPRLTNNNDNINANIQPGESVDEEKDVDTVTFSPISTVTPSSSVSRKPANQVKGRTISQSKQTPWLPVKSSKLVDSVSDLKRLNPPSTGSNRLSRTSSTSTLSTRSDLYDIPSVTTPSPPTSLPLVSTTRSSSLQAAFDSAFKAAALADDKVTTTHSTINNNNKLEKQKQVASLKNTKTPKATVASLKKAPVIGGKSSFTVETGDFGWSTDINHNGNGNSEVKLLTRKSGVINPSFQSERLVDDEISDDVDDESVFTTTLAPITTTIVPTTTTRKVESTSKLTTRRRVTGGITRSTTTKRPTTVSQTSANTATTPGGSFVTFTDDEVKTTVSNARLQGDVKGRSTSRPERLELSTQVNNDQLSDSKLTKKSGFQFNNLQANPGAYDASVEREDGNSASGEQIDGSGEKNEEDCRLEDAIPGTPLTDYPTYQSMPVTAFKCSDVEYPGYYGDVEAQCQVFHVCQTDGRKNDFLCPIGTIFNQELLVCDWWQNFRCTDTANYYTANANLYMTSQAVDNQNVNVNNQLRKRTDAIEREGDDDRSNNNNAEDSVSDEIDGNDYETTNVDGESPTAVSSPPGPIGEARLVSESVKGGKSSLTRYTEAVKQLTLTAPRSVKNIKKTTRVSAGYGARLISLEDTLDSVALASNLAKVTQQVANSTSPSDNQSNKMNSNESSTSVSSLSSPSPSPSPSSSSSSSAASSSPRSSTSSSSSSSVTSTPLQYKATSQYVSPLEGMTSSSSLLFSSSS